MRLTLSTSQLCKVGIDQAIHSMSNFRRRLMGGIVIPWMSLFSNFVRRITAGGVYVGGNKARIDSVHGNTIVWNQLCPLFTDFHNDYLAGDCTYENNGRKVNFPVTGIAYKRDFSNQVIVGHKYLFRCKYSNDAGNELILQFNNGNGMTSKIITVEETASFSAIAIPTINNNQFVVIYSTGDASAYVEDLTIIDLTQMFGAGNEPSTVAEFESWLAANHLTGYQPYNAGTLRMVTKPSWIVI